MWQELGGYLAVPFEDLVYQTELATPTRMSASRASARNTGMSNDSPMDCRQWIEDRFLDVAYRTITSYIERRSLATII
jgi:hypothetical protein